MAHYANGTCIGMGVCMYAYAKPLLIVPSTPEITCKGLIPPFIRPRRGEEFINEIVLFITKRLSAAEIRRMEIAIVIVIFVIYRNSKRLENYLQVVPIVGFLIPPPLL